MSVRIFSSLVRVETRLWARIEAELKAAQAIGLAQYEVLHILVTEPGVKASRIAEELSITSGGISKILDRLANNGFIERCAHASDRRAQTLTVTPAGREAHDRAGGIVDEVASVVFAEVLSAEERERFAADLAALAKNL